MHVVSLFATCLALTGCSAQGLSITTPVGSIGLEHKPSEYGDVCSFDGNLKLPAGTTWTCGPSEDEEAEDETEAAATSETSASQSGETSIPPAVQDQGPDMPEGQADASPPSGSPNGPDSGPDLASAATTTTAIDPPPADPSPADAPLIVSDELFEIVVDDEGWNNVAYCDTSGLHVGAGFKLTIPEGFYLSDDEIQATLCRKLDESQIEARELVGDATWAVLNEVRRDVLTVLCFWVRDCSDFDDTARLIQAGNYPAAAKEMLRNDAGDGPSDIVNKSAPRANRLSREMATGER